VRLEELGESKNPITSSGIEPATFRLVLRYRLDLQAIYVNHGVKFCFLRYKAV
jgi:hypothetical protein